MAFDHQKLVVYQRALDVLELCDDINSHLPQGRAHLRDQIDRAANSIIGNTAEGAGEFSPNEKARFYRMAPRSGIELAAWLEVVGRRTEAPQDLLSKALSALEEVVSMLVALIKRADRSASGQGQGQGQGQGG